MSRTLGMASNFPRRTALCSSSPLRHRIGLDKVMWGGDHPHDEGTAPCFLDALAAEAGPTVEEIAQPLQEAPADATGPAFAPGGSVRVW
ncbi:hypothetical protein GCM10018987_43030 [Streptomyces cremeus]